MNRDSLLRTLFVVFLGICVPLLSGIISYSHHRWQYLVSTTIYFIFVFAISWITCRVFNSRIRALYPITGSPFLKMLLLCLSSSLIVGSLLSTATVSWLSLTDHSITWSGIRLAVILSTIFSVIFTLLFEVARLSYERLNQRQVVRRLDKKWHKAEMNALKYEMDPHFIFNSLNTLSHLINTDSSKALLFNQKLAQVYKYFLTTKNKDLIPVAKELAFIKDYVFLLNIRYSEKLTLDINMADLDVEQTMIVPCALQVPIENAIKHNEFTALEPLTIRIFFDGNVLQVSNVLRPKQYAVESTSIGLSNLNNRYQLACQQAIDVLKTNHEFIVKLPLVA